MEGFWEKTTLPSLSSTTSTKTKQKQQQQRTYLNISAITDPILQEKLQQYKTTKTKTTFLGCDSIERNLVVIFFGVEGVSDI